MEITINDKLVFSMLSVLHFSHFLFEDFRYPSYKSQFEHITPWYPVLQVSFPKHNLSFLCSHYTML